MKKFNYRAKDQQGKLATGVVEAKDERQAIALLHERGLAVISLFPIKEKAGLKAAVKIFEKVSLNDLVNFTRQLSTMTTAGLSITESLSILEAQLSPAMGKVVGEVLRAVQGGQSLAEALGKHPQAFSPIYVATVRAGETAGALEKVLARLADNLEKQREFGAKVKTALIYPAIVIIAMIAVAAIMMIFVIPNMLIIYEEFEAELPITTKFLISASKITSSFWWLGLIFIFGLVYVFSVWKGTKVGKRQYDEFLFKIPILGNLNKQIILTELTRTLALMAGAGIPIIEALNVVAETTGNEVYKEELGQAASKVERGMTLAVSVAESGNFPAIFSQMISVGEETGSIDDVLMKLSAYFEMESDQALKGLTTAIEPAIMIVLGIGVGFMMFAIIMPIYNLVSQF